MKILHIVPSYKPAYIYGGTIESVSRLCEGLVRAGMEVKVFTTTANGKDELDVKTNIEYDVEGVKVVYFKRLTKDHSHITFSLWKQLYRECKNYDVVHIHSWWNILVLIAAWICKRQKVRSIISPHGMLSDYIISNSNSRKKQLLHATFGRRLLRTSVFHATAASEAEECKKLIPGWQGFILPNIIWLPQLEIQKNQNQHFTILFLSRIHPKKGIEMLMEAVSRLNEKVCLWIAGTGEKTYIKALKKKAKELKIEDKISWLGWKNRIEKFQVLMQADLFALTSYNENFANVVIEALHVGTPVLLSAEVGLSRFVDEKKLGWVCSLQPEAIKKKLEAIIACKEEHRRITAAAPVIIKESFSEEILIPQYIRHYQA